MPVVVHPRADALPAADWQRLSGGDAFLGGAFLAAAETHGAAAPAMGWEACHLAWHADSTDTPPGGLLPLYRRTHSFGDFSRDWGWPEAWQRAGRPYYPKLVSGLPYTPAPGPRLLAGAERHRAAPALIEAAIDTARACDASSWQCLFVDEADRALLADAGLLMRRGVQFHWHNRGYRDFDDFLAGFTADKRKKLKRERRAVQEAGLRLEVRHGHEIDAPLWAAIHRHYRDTFLRYGNHPAFSASFFADAGAALGTGMVVFLAWDGERPVASAICYRDATTLHGRHWGSERAVSGLHFELCYYQGIDYAIRHGLTHFKPGAQGEHKLARGFEPAATWCAYWIAEPRLRRAVADFLVREDGAMQDYEAEAAAHLPFRQPAAR